MSYADQPSRRQVPHQLIGGLLAVAGAVCAVVALNINAVGFEARRYFIKQPGMVFWLGLLVFFGGLIWYAHGRTKEERP